MKRAVIAAALALVCSATTLPTIAATTSSVAPYAIDPSHSNVEFIARHMVIQEVRGRFRKFAGTLTIANDASIPTAVAVQIDAASVDTREEQRDDHLRSAAFFDAKNHPKLIFTSTAIAGSGSSFTITGDLSIRGVTKSVTIDAELERRDKDPWGNERLAYSAKTKVHRKDFGLTWNQALETGGVLVGDEIAIELEIQAVRHASRAGDPG
jgi:polyisoprenoid-binding protein YceI